MLILSVNWPLVVLGHIVVIFIFRSRDREVPAVIVLADFRCGCSAPCRQTVQVCVGSLQVEVIAAFAYEFLVLLCQNSLNQRIARCVICDRIG